MPASPSTLQQEQFSRILVLFQAAMPLLRRDGFWQDIEGYPARVRSFEHGELMMLHRTPFQPVPVSVAGEAGGYDADAQKRAARGYGLDVWWQRHKVLSLIWNDGGSFGVVMYKEGQWQQSLTELAAASQAAAAQARLPQQPEGG